MKTSKRKRSSKSEPVVQAADVVSAPAAVSAEPAVAEIVAVAVNEPVVAEVPLAEAVVEQMVAEAANSEPVALEAPSAPVIATDIEPVIVLAANCSVKDAASLKTSLCALAQETSSVTLDASAVERVDTATMQLLCAFVRDRISRNQSILWRGKSQALQDAVRLLGVAALLGFEDVQGVAA